MTTPDKKYLPTSEAWKRYTSNGGGASYVARAINMENGTLVALSGIVGYWWRRDQLVENPMLVIDEVINIQPGQTEPPEPPPPIPVPTPPVAKVLPTVEDWVLYLRTPLGDLTSAFDADEDELYIQEDPRADPDCEGDDCEDCDGSGCEVEPERVTARDVISHFYESSSHDVNTAATEFGVSTETIDDILQDVLTLLGGLRMNKPE